jgi:hypothetical protein
MFGSRNCSSQDALSLTTMTGCELCFRAVGGWLVGGLLWEVGAAGIISSVLGNHDP